MSEQHDNIMKANANKLNEDPALFGQVMKVVEFLFMADGEQRRERETPNYPPDASLTSKYYVANTE